MANERPSVPPSGQPTPVLELDTLGPVRLQAGGQAPPPELLWRKHLALLVYLARSPRRTRARSHLIGLFWPDKDESAARHSLNEALRVLRRAIGADGLDVNGDQVRLADHTIGLDVDRLDELVHEARWREAAALVLGPFLEGFALAGAAEFEDWLAAERHLWGGHGVRALVGWSGALLDHGDASGALAAAERALRLVPTAEPAIRAAVEALSVLGLQDRAAARLEEFGARLERDLGLTLSPTLATLASRVKAGAHPARVSPPAPESNPRRPPLVGREPELTVLLGWWRGLGGPTLGILSGELGTGKSRLLEELGTRAALDGGFVATIRAVPADREMPWSGLLGLAEGPLAHADGVGGAPPSAIAAFARVLPTWAARYPGALAATPLPYPRAMSELLRAVADLKPILLVVDDAEWLDDESALALEAALRDLTGHRIVCLLARNPHHVHPVVDRIEAGLGRDLAGGVLPVGPLGHRGLAALARWAFPHYPDDQLERLVRRVATDSAGIPLLAAELLYAIREGADDPMQPVWPEPLRTLDDSMPVELPSGMIAALRVGFRRLSPSAQQVLATASLLEDRLTSARLAWVAELDPKVVDIALDELEWNRWLVSEPRGYSFVAKITREVVRTDLVTAGHRRRLLARSAEPADEEPPRPTR